MVNRDSSESVVEVTNLARQFGDTMALDGISLRVQPGLVYGLVGANGAGKTTLIKHLIGSLRKAGIGPGVRHGPGAESGRGAAADWILVRRTRHARVDAD